MQGICIKLGGASITNKGVHETLNIEALNSVIQLIAQIYERNTLPIVIHGAGSFGHFEAKEYGVNKGIHEGHRILMGIALTRKSVTKLNTIVVNALIEKNLPAVSISVFSLWSFEDQDQSALVMVINTLLSKKLIPVLHGDVVIGGEHGSQIISGDLIAEKVSIGLSIARTLFITDVHGVFDKPPSIPDSKILPIILVENESQGESSSSTQVVTSGSQHVHDVSGGMQAKLSSSINIAKKGLVVDIVSLNATNLLDVCVLGVAPNLGTRVTCKPS